MSNKIKILGHDFSDDHHLVKPGRSMHDAIDLVKCLASDAYKKFSNIDEDKAAIDCKDSENYSERAYYEYATSMTEHKRLQIYQTELQEWRTFCSLLHCQF